MKLNFHWKKKVGPFQTGESLYLNRIVVGGYYWNDTRPRGSSEEATTWNGIISLPSLKTKEVYGSTPDEVKTKIETVVKQWFKEALVKVKGGD